MKIRLFLLCLFGTCCSMFPFLGEAQFTHKIKADSVRIYNDNCTAELIVENSTSNISGFLFNKGGGRTEFRKAVIRLNDSSFLIGGDTLKMQPVFNGLQTGSVLFYGGTAINQDNANFYWDNINKRLGIGTSSPSFLLDIKKNGLNAPVVQQIKNVGTSINDDAVLTFKTGLSRVFSLGIKRSTGFFSITPTSGTLTGNVGIFMDLSGRTLFGTTTDNGSDIIQAVGTGLFTLGLYTGISGVSNNTGFLNFDGSVITKLQGQGGNNVGVVGTQSTHDFNIITDNSTRININASSGAATFSSSLTARNLRLDEAPSHGSGRIELYSNGTRFGFMGTGQFVLGDETTNFGFGSETGKGFVFAVNGTSSPTFKIQSDGVLNYSAVAGYGNRVMATNNGGELIALTIGSGLSISGSTLSVTGSSSVTGTGSTGYIPVWNGVNSLTNSSITISDTYIYTNQNTLVSNFNISGNASKNIALMNSNVNSDHATAIYMGYNSNGSDPYGTRIVATGYPWSTRRGGFKFQSHGDASGNGDSYYYNLLSLEHSGNASLRNNFGIGGVPARAYSYGGGDNPGVNFGSRADIFALSNGSLYFGSNLLYDEGWYRGSYSSNYGLMFELSSSNGQFSIYTASTGAPNTAASLTNIFSVSRNGDVTASSFSGAGMGLTGTASSLTAGYLHNRYITTDANQLWQAGTYTFFNGTNVPGGDFGMISFPTWGSTNASSRYNIQIGGNINSDLKFRSTDINGNGVWSTLLSSYNFTNYSPSLTGSGASGTWGISITGNSATATNSSQWNGNIFSGASSGSDAYFMTSPDATTWKYSNITQAQNMLGLGTAAYRAANQDLNTTNSPTFATVYATGDVIAYYSSDPRFKNNMKPIRNAVDLLGKMNGYSFEWNNQQSTYAVGTKDLGLNAEEIYELFKDLPGVVTIREDGSKAIMYHKTIPILVEAIKELKNEIEKLKTKK